LLVQRGADVNARDMMGDSPLSLAREHWPMPLLANYMLKLIPAPPTWVADTIEHCQSCGTGWSVTTRRHHCRHCASLVCSTCSVHRVAIPKFNILSAVRVCNSCHEALSWPAAVQEVDDDPFDRRGEEPSYNSTMGSSFDAPGPMRFTLNSSLDGSFGTGARAANHQQQQHYPVAKSGFNSLPSSPTGRALSPRGDVSFDAASGSGSLGNSSAQTGGNASNSPGSFNRPNVGATTSTTIRESLGNDKGSFASPSRPKTTRSRHIQVKTRKKATVRQVTLDD
jgi:hypothetical protein